MRLFGRPLVLPARPSRSVEKSASRPAYGRRCGVEGLESRILFHLELASALPNTAVAPGAGTSEINLAAHFASELINGTIVRFATDVGNIDMEMFDQAAPLNVANFLGYVTRGDYNNTFIHRSVPGFVVQGGGFRANPDLNQITTHIPQQAKVPNEFSSQRPNVRATVAMAKVAGFDDQNDNGIQDPGEPTNPDGGPDSATSEFFVNLDDNRGTFPFGLDFQNGGFTVFAKVVNNGMAAVDAIAALPRVNSPFIGLPIQGEAPLDSVDELVVVTSASVVPESALFNYTVTSSNPTLVNGVVENGVLRLSYGAGLTGTADVTVTATDATDGTTVSDTFTAGVGVLDVQIGTGGAKAVTFTDADGTVATVSLKGGAGTVRFTGSDLTQAASKRGATVAGNITDLSIDMTGTGSSGALTVKAAGGDGLISVNRIASDAGMRSVAARQVNVVGGAVSFAGNVARADFADVTDSVLTFGGSGGGLALSLRNANGSNVVSQIPIKSLKAASFAGAGPENGVVTAPSLGALTVAGDFGGQLNLAGSLGNARIGGAASTFLPWSVGGGAGKLSLGSTTEGFVADFLGGVAALTVAGNLTGDIAASTIKALTVKGDLTSANLTLTGPGAALGRANISGSINTSRIQATNGIGTVTAAAINSSTIYAGLTTDGGVLPSSPADLNPGPSEIKSVTVKGAGGAPSFVNSSIAARTLGKLSLGAVQAGNGSVPFGVAADTIASLTFAAGSTLKLAKLTEPSQSQTQQDFLVTVL